MSWDESCALGMPFDDEAPGTMREESRFGRE
jgi:hypothetical protein